jgi:hypothetical protein
MDDVKKYHENVFFRDNNLRCNFFFLISFHIILNIHFDSNFSVVTPDIILNTLLKIVVQTKLM